MCLLLLCENKCNYSKISLCYFYLFLKLNHTCMSVSMSAFFGRERAIQQAIILALVTGEVAFNVEVIVKSCSDVTCHATILPQSPVKSENVRYASIAILYLIVLKVQYCKGIY